MLDFAELKYLIKYYADEMQTESGSGDEDGSGSGDEEGSGSGDEEGSGSGDEEVKLIFDLNGDGANQPWEATTLAFWKK